MQWYVCYKDENQHTICKCFGSDEKAAKSYAKSKGNTAFAYAGF